MELGGHHLHAVSVSTNAHTDAQVYLHKCLVCSRMAINPLTEKLQMISSRLSGLSPFLGDDDSETLNNILQCQWNFEEDEFIGISDEAKDFISKLLLVNKRYLILSFPASHASAPLSIGILFLYLNELCCHHYLVGLCFFCFQLADRCCPSP